MDGLRADHTASGPSPTAMNLASVLARFGQGIYPRRDGEIRPTAQFFIFL